MTDKGFPLCYSPITESERRQRDRYILYRRYRKLLNLPDHRVYVGGDINFSDDGMDGYP